MRQRLIQVLGRQDDTDPRDGIVGHFWAPAKPRARLSLPLSDRATVVDLAQWLAAREGAEK